MHEQILTGRGGNAFDLAMGGQAAANPPKEVPALAVALSRLVGCNDRLEHLQSRLLSVAINAGLIQLPTPTGVVERSPDRVNACHADIGPGMLLRISEQQSRLEQLLETLTDIVVPFESLA